jgi:hypothetical protein
MKLLKTALGAAAGSILMLTLFTGCESTDSGGSGSASVSGGVYYGAGLYDPWYYGGYYPPDVIVTPPPGGSRPDNGGLRPTHPIATPPSAPSVSPMPSIPSTPRVSGGRR